MRRSYKECSWQYAHRFATHRREAAFRARTGGAVGLQHILEALYGTALVNAQDRFDQLRDLHETDTPFEEPRHCDFVGGIERRGGASARGERFVREAQTGKTGGIGRLEMKRPDAREVEKFDACLDALRKSQRVRDRRAHI